MEVSLSRRTIRLTPLHNVTVCVFSSLVLVFSCVIVFPADHVQHVTLPARQCWTGICKVDLPTDASDLGATF